MLGVVVTQHLPHSVMERHISLKKLKQSENIQQISHLIQSPDITPDEVGKAGIKLFLAMYDGQEQDSLNKLRYVKFMEMVTASKSSLDPRKLPPTERAAYYHSLRVHLQTVLWEKLICTFGDLDVLRWEWKVGQNVLTPILTDLEAAPDNLLMFVRCKCKMSSRSPCSSNICSCRKNGLMCVTACAGCRGQGCCNSEPALVEDDNENQDEQGSELYEC